MKALWLAIGLSALLGCGQRAEDGASGGDPEAGGTLAQGELLSLACRACHSFGPGEPAVVGPNLYGFFGRRAGTAPGFDNYSTALRESGIVWSPVELDRWLEDPIGFLPGTSMAFTGYQSAADRAALIGYLLRVTSAVAE